MIIENAYSGAKPKHIVLRARYSTFTSREAYLRMKETKCRVQWPSKVLPLNPREPKGTEIPVATFRRLNPQPETCPESEYGYRSIASGRDK